MHQILKVGVDAKVAEKIKDVIAAEMSKFKASLDECKSVTANREICLDVKH